MISKICGASNHFHQVGLITVHQPFLALFLRSKDSVLVLNHWIFHLHLAYIHLTPSTRLKYTLWLFLPTMPLANEGLYPNPPIFPNHPTANSLGTSLPNLLDFISSLTVTAKKGTRSAFHKHNRWPTGHLPPPRYRPQESASFFQGAWRVSSWLSTPPTGCIFGVKKFRIHGARWKIYPQKERIEGIPSPLKTGQLVIKRTFHHRSKTINF